MGGDPETLLGEPGALQLDAVADAADHRVSGDLDVGEPDRRVAVRVVVRELRVVDELDTGGVGLDQEQRRQPVGAVDDVGHHDQHAGDVAGGHEPLLAVDPPAAVGRDRGRRDPAGVRAGLGLGHRVGVAALAAQRRRDIALDLLGRPLSSTL